MSSWQLAPGTFPAMRGGAETHLGRGLHWPLREDPVTGDFQRVDGPENVRLCVKGGILTAFGERLMREGLGTVCRDMLFEESPIVGDLVPPSITEFIQRWEPRVILQGVNVKLTAETDDLVEFSCSVVYVLRATSSRESLVFPFTLTRD